MALGANFLTVPGVETIADDGQKAIDKLLEEAGKSRTFEFLVADTKNKLLNLKDQLEKQQNELLRKLNCSSLEELKGRVDSFYADSGYQKFTGVDLKSIINSFTLVTDQGMQERQELYERILYNSMREDVMEILSSSKIINAVRDDAIAIVHRAVSSFSNKGVTVKEGKFISKDENGALRILATESTAAFKRNLSNLQKTAALNKAKTKKSERGKIDLARELIKPIPAKAKMGKNEITMDFGARIATIAGKFTPEEAKKLPPQELGKINAEIRELIVGQLDFKYQPLARKLINQMLNKSGGQYTFFLSGSSQQLEGILGEIAAVHAIVHILGPQGYSKAVDWVATRKISGKQLSVDIILRDIAGIDIGIQVKNTIKDLDKSIKIPFADASIETIFNKLNIPTEHLEDVMTSNIFNVPFRLNGQTYEKVSSGYTPDDPVQQDLFTRFLKAEEIIDETSLLIKAYLLQYAPNLLYMSLGDSFEKEVANLNSSISSATGNLIYLVGNKIYFATEMLQNIYDRFNELEKIEQLKQQSILSMTIYIPRLEKGEQSMNIVNYFNGTAGKSKGLSKYSTKMKTSYTFKS